MIIDLPRKFKQLCDGLGIEYAYGNIQNLNLVLSVMDEDKVYLLQEPATRKFNFSSQKTYTGMTFSGAFSLVKRSSPDMEYFSEMTGSDAESKYTKFIEPMVASLETFAQAINCDASLEIISWSVIDMVDFLDENRDGVLVRFEIKTER